MLRVHLRVLPEKSAQQEDRGEDWGEWDFVSLPRTGDHIEVSRDETAELLTVRRVIHFAAQHPLPRTETPFKQRTQPTICIVAVREVSSNPSGLNA
jgi:hypothetical protein